jgi:tetratricopeptide (TPR) repeat protein
MKRVLAIAYLMAACAAAKAGGYADFGAGIDANNRGEPERAAIHFSLALTAGDLPESYVPAALLGRARAELRLRRCDKARRDLDLAIARKPDFADAFSLRAEAQQCGGNSEAALADANRAVILRPAAGYFFTRSRLEWNHGDLTAAHRDAEAAAAHDPGNAYFQLWASVTAAELKRSPQPAIPPHNGSGDWPGPLLDLFNGSAAPEQVWQAAGDDQGRACEADFFVGAWFQAQGRNADAKPLYARAAATCPRDFVAFEAAESALKRLE